MYEAVIDGKVTEEDRQAFAEGLDIGDDKPTLPAELTILETTEKEPGIFESRIRITICEGRFHQIKRMFEKVGKTVVYLKRLSMGSLKLDPGAAKGQCPSPDAGRKSGAWHSGRRNTERKVKHAFFTNYKRRDEGTGNRTV